MRKEAHTVTYGNRGENHIGNQVIGDDIPRGLGIDDFHSAAKELNSKGVETRIVNLAEEAGIGNVQDVPAAFVMVIKNGVNVLTEGKFDTFKHEVASKDMDDKALMYGQVRNKHARHNCLFGPTAQSPNYEIGNGTVYAFTDNPTVNEFKRSTTALFHMKDVLAVAEVNHYFDISKCGIGWHGK
jgi:hypothetical protein